jgi:hypothetical protein
MKTSQEPLFERRQSGRLVASRDASYARATLGHGTAYMGLQVVTAGIPILAANTSFSDFPRLAYFLARDGHLPRAFSFRGDRLAFTCSPASMSLRWWRRREPGWRTGLAVNGAGAFVTAVVSLVIIATKAAE